MGKTDALVDRQTDRQTSHCNHYHEDKGYQEMSRAEVTYRANIRYLVIHTYTHSSISFYSTLPLSMYTRTYQYAHVVQNFKYAPASYGMNLDSQFVGTYCRNKSHVAVAVVADVGEERLRCIKGMSDKACAIRE